MIDSKAKVPENRIHLFDPVGLINEKYANYGVRPRQATTNVANGGPRFTAEPKADDSDSGSSSPRLWKSNTNPNGNSPPTSPRFTASPQHQLQNPSSHSPYQNPESMSPNSRTQAIARGRKELMDMIKDLPESYYDLSLRDIVDQKPSLSSPPPLPPASPPATVEKPSHVGKKLDVVERKIPQQETLKDDNSKKKKKEGKDKKEGKKKKVGKSESKKKMMRNRSLDNGGFLLKTTVFPIPFRSKKKKRSLSNAPSFKVAQKSSSKGTEKRWWVRKSRVSNEIESTNTSRSNSTVSRYKQNPRFLPSCCAFLNEKKTKSKK